jgi:UDP-N-acetyl-D-glucosamine dehydrogenase
MTGSETTTDERHLAGASMRLRERIESGGATVGIIGLGYVGLPLASALHRDGLGVLGFDVDQRKIDALARGENYLKHLGDEMTSDLSRSDRFEATTDFGRLGEADAILVCVPTPLGKHHEPDLSYVIDSARAIGRTLRRGQLIVLESTTYPRTTRDEFLPAMLEAASEAGCLGDAGEPLVCGEDFFVAFSPEREDPGRKSHSTASIPKLVGGLDAESTSLAVALYMKGIENVVEVSSAEVAESAKLLENIFRAVNIAMVNEMKVILAAMDIDIWEVIEAAATKPFGFMPFYPGPGLGGHCIPIDPYYLTWKAKEVGRPTKFIELAGEVNTAMPGYVVERLTLALNARGKSVQGSNILVVGLAYKPDVDDTRESPSFEIIDQLRALGGNISYHDPYIPKTVPVRKHDLQMSSVGLSAKSIEGFDAIVIATNHACVDYGLIAKHAQLIVDTRNAMRSHAEQLGTKLVRA